VQVDRRGAACVVAVRDLSTLDDGAAVEGPVLLDGRDTTVWVPPGARARRGESGTLVVEVVDG
jgi:N-methylhydantoinase A/oxoprolinase/acetone carboxylase beta subunit